METRYRIEITATMEDGETDFDWTVERQSRRDSTDWDVLRSGSALSLATAALQGAEAVAEHPPAD